MKDTTEPPARTNEDTDTQERAPTANTALPGGQWDDMGRELLNRVSNLEAQQQFLLQHVTYLLQAVNRQSNVLSESEDLLRTELMRFQTGGPQRAMASIFYKLFRDLLKVMNQLDGLASLGNSGERTEEEQPWIQALKMLHGQMEFILHEWGCVEMAVEPFVTQFDPSFHEAAPADEETPACDPSGKEIPQNTVVKVEQRGWVLQDTILQYPQVVVH